MQTSLQTSQELRVSGATGTVCPKSGPYHCNTHSELILFIKKDDKFPMCPVDKGHPTTWSMIRSQ